jgi:hypothetical protein
MPFVCPVCGFDELDEPPYSRDGFGLFEICPSCYFQFGVTDDDQGISFAEWRKQWVSKGMPWSSKRPVPLGWNPREQLERLERAEQRRS